MIEIVSFKRKTNQIEIGYRKGDAVVYAAVNGDLSDSTAKQKGYEKVWRALEYEQTLEVPSFAIGDNTDDDGNVIEYEKFTPDKPQATRIEIEGPTSISFEDESPSKEVEYTAKAYDQYGEVIDTSIEWTGADDGVLTVENTPGTTYEVSVKAGDVTKTITVTVIKSNKSIPLEEEFALLKAQNKATSERAEFIEDVVAEMATKVYQ